MTTFNLLSRELARRRLDGARGMVRNTIHFWKQYRARTANGVVYDITEADLRARLAEEWATYRRAQDLDRAAARIDAQRANLIHQQGMFDMLRGAA